MRMSVTLVKSTLLVLLSATAFSERAFAEQVTVAFGSTVYAESANINLTFESVSDHRCPADVYCFWEGCASIVLLVSTDSRSYEVGLPIMGTVIEPSGRSLAPIDAIGFRFTLMRLLPYPMEQDSASNDDYEAVIRIEPLPKIGGVDGSVVIANSICARSGNAISADSAYLNYKILGIGVTYSGGCFEPYFMLHWNELNTGSDPDTIYLSLRGYRYGDFICNQWITEQLAFDLTPAIEFYEEQVGGPHLVVFSIDGNAVIYDPTSCCSDVTGNIDCDINNKIDIADLTTLIDHLFIARNPLCCPGEANIDGDDEINIADLTFLIDHLFITLTDLPECQ